MTIGFKYSNESDNDSNDDNNVNSPEVIFSESQSKDVEHVHELSF